MLETIREYSNDQLVGVGEDDAAFDAFLTWMSRVVGGIDVYWVDRDQLEWFETLEHERANLLEAAAGCRVRGRSRDEARLWIGAYLFFDTRGPYETIAARLSNLRTGDGALDGRVSCTRGFLLYRAGRIVEALDEFTAAYRLGLEAGDDALAGRACALLGAVGEGDVDLAEKGVELARKSGNRHVLAEAITALAIAVSSDPSRARQLFVEAQLLAREMGDERNAMLIDGNLVEIALALSKPDEAAVAARRAIKSARRFGDMLIEAFGHLLLATSEVAIGEPQAARASTSLALELMEEAGIRHDSLLIDALYTLAMADAEAEATTAITLWSAAERLQSKAASAMSPSLVPYVNRHLEPLRAHPAFTRAWDEGETLSLDEALELGCRS
jgi:tetratricopeptide (TPR) repeat protein